MRKPNIPELLTVRQVADEIGVTVQTVYSWINEGRFRIYRPSKKKTWVYAEDVYSLMEASISGTAPAIRELVK